MLKGRGGMGHDEWRDFGWMTLTMGRRPSLPFSRAIARPPRSDSDRRFSIILSAVILRRAIQSGFLLPSVCHTPSKAVWF